MQAILDVVMQNENEPRKEAEAKLNSIKAQDPNMYASCMVYILNPQVNAKPEIKSLVAVILRRNISISDVDAADITNKDNNANLWMRLSDQTRNTIKSELLNVLNNCADWPKNIVHKVCSLAVEVQGAMQDQEDKGIWNDLINLVNTLISTGIESKIDAALQIFNGLFGYIMEHMIQFKDDLATVFKNTLNHQSLDIKLAALQAVSNLLSTAERKDVKAFTSLIPDMTAVIMNSYQAQDEVVLEDALVEFNELAEIEPLFFKPYFKDVYNALKPIISCEEFANVNIRQQPLEFVVTLVERKPSLVQKDTELIKDILE